MATRSRSMQSLSTPLPPSETLYATSTRSLSTSATFPVQRPSRALLSPSPQKSARVVLGDRTNTPASASPVKKTAEKPAAPQSLPARSTVCVAAENNAVGICIFIQSPTLVNVKDLWVEDLPGDIALLAVPRTPVHWAQLRAKGAQTAHACAKAHLAALRKEPDVEARKQRRAWLWNALAPDCSQVHKHMCDQRLLMCHMRRRPSKMIMTTRTDLGVLVIKVDQE
ncbi:hypothetical protein BOTBODRAFT_147484 [Botryobasidium botryosum FD-172 SS1]|uniref:Uncharacterized protein n=1 Tax=Botryobasidium botryosum (strain FD-172 SS1) TaxID=930990 RepID=A0A067MG68_BOTB1|nr:hypothetical protein BOTBODRAFT_147484 [Botryobasidium botryosum FD-172 SS1]